MLQLDAASFLSCKIALSLIFSSSHAQVKVPRTTLVLQVLLSKQASSAPLARKQGTNRPDMSARG